MNGINNHTHEAIMLGSSVDIGMDFVLCQFTEWKTRKSKVSALRQVLLKAEVQKRQTPYVERVPKMESKFVWQNPNFSVLMVSLSAPELASLGHCIGMHKAHKERKLICSHPRNPGGQFESSGWKNPIFCLGEGEATGSEALGWEVHGAA